MRSSSKNQPVEDPTNLWSFIMKIKAKENAINDMQLPYKHWVPSKNRHALDFKCTSAVNEDFDPEDISSFIIVYYI